MSNNILDSQQAEIITIHTHKETRRLCTCEHVWTPNPTIHRNIVSQINWKV